jgi:2-polyprenyl-6-methoxyphenol hydroxylase-like FAD-dependent oxidoreductase
MEGQMLEQTDVLIVGAGPAGLATAIGLAQHGVGFQIVDAASEGQNTSRAAVIHAATLETLSRLGVADALLAQGIKVPHFRVRDRGRVILEIEFTRLAGLFPFALMIPQEETEAILTARLQSLGHSVQRPLRLMSVEQKDDGAITQFADGRTTRARFVVGADGEKSSVRAAANISFPGDTYGSFLLADVRMSWPLPRNEVGLFFAQEGTLVVAPLSASRVRIVAQLADAPSQPTVSDVQRVLDARGPGGRIVVEEVVWGSRFQVHHKLADRFRDGPFLLVGDAAHVHSPAGGQGMNLGLRDAEALADALTRELAGTQGQLDLYASTRRKSAAQVLSRTDRLTRLATVRGRFARSARNTLIRSLGASSAVRDTIAKMLAGYG